MNTLSAILWNPDIEIFSIFGISIRYYSVLFVTGLSLAYWVIYKLYQDQKIPYEKFDSLFVYCLLGIVIGARLGHCLFYEPGYWLSHPVEMLLPVKITDSGIKWTGYQGLASHGGTIGLMLALWIYSRRVKLKFLTVLDNIAIATPLAGCFIRLGNLMNGENSRYGNSCSLGVHFSARRYATPPPGTTLRSHRLSSDFYHRLAVV